jgi:hypothetical protein
MFNQNQVPTFGFLLTKWNQLGYRATAHAYLKREGFFSVEHKNGRWYTLTEIENAMIR